MSHQYEPLVSDQSRISWAAWLELMLCLVPVSGGWAFGFGLALACAYDTLRYHDGKAFVLFVLVLAGLGCAVLGIAALWSLVLPRALGRPVHGHLWPWQRLGLGLGAAATLVGVFFVAVNVEQTRMALLWGYLFVSPALVAVHVSGSSRLGRERA